MTDWNKLRPMSGSTREAFEELCCQLAFTEETGANSRFCRKGKPDAGLECYWQCGDGSEWGWQAKYFRTALDDSQWSQLDESIATAITKHPKLTRITVCLPQDLPDARIEGRISSKDKWEKHVSKWQGWATEKGRSVEFELWGNTELVRRLAEERHRGTTWFWFGTEALTDDWFQSLVNEAIANAGNRYTHELHVDTSLRADFEAFGRTKAFRGRLVELYAEYRSCLKEVELSSKHERLAERLKELEKSSSALTNRYRRWAIADETVDTWSTVESIPWEEISDDCARVHSSIYECFSAIDEIRDEQSTAKGGTTTSSYWRPSDEFDYQYRKLRRLSGATSKLYSYSESVEAELSNASAMLLVGEAGQGKTHLVCDLAERDVKDGMPRILLFGEQFHDGEPWSQIIKLVGLDCGRDEFIGALIASAQVRRTRAVIHIDAVNEGDGKKLWRKFLAGMLTRFRDSRWINLCVTVRDTYEDHVIPQDLNENVIVRVEHTGFSENPYGAANKFFAVYGIAPSTPLLLPEFDNPLFLKLFCVGLKNKGLSQVPKGLRGITKIFEFFLQSIDKKLSAPDQLDYDEREQLVVKAVHGLAEEMAKRGTDYLPLEVARSIVAEVLPSMGYSGSLFQRLESESVLAIVPEWDAESDTEPLEYVRFTYQRLSDHLTTKLMLDEHLDIDCPSVAFEKDAPLEKFVRDEDVWWEKHGVLEALAIQMPERIQKELHEVVPSLRTDHSYREAFVDSLVWRQSEKFFDATFEYIDSEVRSYSGTFDALCDALVTLAPTPNHPLNAEFLHGILKQYEMAERDAWWSIFLHREHGEKRSVDRLIDWAWQHSHKAEYGDEVIRLAATTLAWFFTTSNRQLRDTATKSFIRLFDGKPALLAKLIPQFVDVDDVYVVERVMAAAYGCAMRTEKDGQLTELAQDVYDLVFAEGTPPAHSLLRDYARGVVEVALHRGCNISVDVKNIRPPYNSEWPTEKEIPTQEEIAPLSNRPYAYHITSDYEDFAKYITDFSEWRNHRLIGPAKTPRRKVVEAFEESLTDRQWEQWAALEKLYKSVVDERHDRRIYESILKEEATEESALEKQLKRAESAFQRILGKESKKWQLYEEHIRRYLETRHRYSHESHLDAEAARRWMIKKVTDLGWTPERFGKFDAEFERGRDAVERFESISKKYAWIAVREMQSRCSDTFEMSWDYLDNGGVYDGPWELSYGREIDPSNLLSSTGYENYRAHTNTWWFPTAITNWNEPEAELDWLKANDTLPSPKELLSVTSSDGTRWIALDGYYNWEQPAPPGEKHWESASRSMFYMLKGYFVKKSDLEALRTWAQNKRWTQRWMPEAHSRSNVFLGEFPWAAAFDRFRLESPELTEWSQGEPKVVPVPLLVANDEYSHERDAGDSSLEDSIFLNIPSKFIIDELKLRCRGNEGHWYDNSGGLVAFDASTGEDGPGTLLIREASLQGLMIKHELAVFWTMLGERKIVGGNNDDRHIGHTELNGTYIYEGERIAGELHTNFFKHGSWEPPDRHGM